MAFGLDLGNLLVHLRGDEAPLLQSMKNAEKSIRAAADKMTALGRSMTMKVTLPLVLMGAGFTKTFASFDDAMTKSLSIMSGVTPKLRKEMEELATSISKKTCIMIFIHRPFLNVYFFSFEN